MSKLTWTHRIKQKRMTTNPGFVVLVASTEYSSKKPDKKKKDDDKRSSLTMPNKKSQIISQTVIHSPPSTPPVISKKNHNLSDSQPQQRVPTIDEVKKRTGNSTSRWRNTTVKGMNLLTSFLNFSLRSKY